MALTAGTKLGPYEITGPLGKGGMGEVYRATDTSLNRQVAIKVLPAEFAQDTERLPRFEREAKTLASLNHPNIAQTYGLETAVKLSLFVPFPLPATAAKSLIPGVGSCELRPQNGQILLNLTVPPGRTYLVS